MRFDKLDDVLGQTVQQCPGSYSATQSFTERIDELP
jgi:hypothetical protein